MRFRNRADVIEQQQRMIAEVEGKSRADFQFEMSRQRMAVPKETSAKRPNCPLETSHDDNRLAKTQTDVRVASSARAQVRAEIS